jgi:hypothetical protein
VDELAEHYYVPSGLAQSLIDTEQILPLLDGLDEVVPEHRAACVEAINTFRRQHELVPLAVCSCAADYDALPVRVELSGAVVIEPLSRVQVSTYLKQAGKSLAGVRTVLRDDETLWELLDTPLMLSIAALAYQGRSTEEVQAVGSLEARRMHLFAAYTTAMFESQTKRRTYTREETIRWLSWLARSLMHNNLSIFYMEWMQPDLLPSHVQRRIVAMAPIVFRRLVVGLDIGLVVGLIDGLIDGLVFVLVFALVFMLVLGLVFGMVFGMVGRLQNTKLYNIEGRPWSWTREGRPWSWTRARRTFVSKLAGTLIRGLVLGPVFGLVGGLVLGAGFMLSYGFDNQILKRTIPNEVIRRSPRGALIGFLALGLVVGLVVGLRVGLVEGLVVGLVVGLLGRLTNGVSAYLKHYVLRFLLWCNGYAPWNYIRFLDYAAERVFLRKVGSSYIFTHRLLMEYFATLQPTDQARQTKTE